MPASLRTSRVGRVTKPAPSISTLLQAEKSPCQPPSGMRPMVLVVAMAPLAWGVVRSGGMGWVCEGCWGGRVQARHGGAVLLLRSHLFSVRQKPCLLCCGGLYCGVLDCVLCSQAISKNCAGEFRLSPGRIQGKPRRLVFVFVGWVPSLQSQVESGRAFADSTAGHPSRLLPVSLPACVPACPYRVQNTVLSVPITAPNFKEG